MAEYRYGYRTVFDTPTPVEKYAEPQFQSPSAKVTASNPQASNLLSKLSLKDPKIAFNIDLKQNPGSDITKTIDAQKLFKEVPGADPSKQSGVQRIAVQFEQHALPKLQSFKSAVHSKGGYHLLVGGRLAGLHPFGGKGFTDQLESHVLFVVDMTNFITIAAALPEEHYNTVGLMNAQSYQVMRNGKNYLFVVGGYGYSATAKPEPTMVTLNTVTVINVDEVIDSMIASAAVTTAGISGAAQVPKIAENIWQACHEKLQVTGGELLFNPASNEPITNKDCFYLVVGQTYHGSYASQATLNSPPDLYSYTRGMRKFEVPYPKADGTLPCIIVTEILATKDTTEAHDPEAINVQLARRDLNVVPNLLHSTFTPSDGKAYVGALILSGVFNQDGSDAPYLQPLMINFNPILVTQSSNPKKIPIYTSRSFFQLFNNYDCPNIQLFSAKQGVMYHVLLGGVSYFYAPKDSSAPEYLIDQASDMFQAPFTTDVSIIKMDNDGNFSQRLSPPSEDFFKTTKLTTFGAEGLFMRNRDIPLSQAFTNDANHEIEILDLDWVKSQKSPYRLGTIYGGIESTKGRTNPPKFQPSDTDAASRLIDVLVTFT